MMTHLMASLRYCVKLTVGLDELTCVGELCSHENIKYVQYVKLSTYSVHQLYFLVITAEITTACKQEDETAKSRTLIVLSLIRLQ